MFNFDHLKFVLDDTLHPGTSPAWIAIVMAVIIVLLAGTFFKPLVGWIRRKRRHGYDACLAYHQKIHEGERW